MFDDHNWSYLIDVTVKEYKCRSQNELREISQETFWKKYDRAIRQGMEPVPPPKQKFPPSPTQTAEKAPRTGARHNTPFASESFWNACRFGPFKYLESTELLHTLNSVYKFVISVQLDWNL